MRSLADWLEQQQKSHPSAIDLTLDARARGRAAPRSADAAVPRDHGRRHQRQGIDGRLPRCAAARGGQSHRALHLAAPRALQRTHLRQWQRSLRRRAHRVLRAHRGGARRDHAHVLRIQHARRARSVPARRASTSRCSRSDSAGGSMPPTSSMPTSAWSARSASITSTGWATRSSRSGARRPASSGRARPAVLGSADLPASVRQVIEEIGAFPVALGRDFRARRHANGWDFECNALRLRNLPLPALAGPQQIDNAATALAALAVRGFGSRARRMPT